MVQKKFGLPVGVLHPQKEGSVKLRDAAAFFRPIPRGALAACQFPPTMRDAVGRFTKPPTWAEKRRSPAGDPRPCHARQQGESWLIITQGTQNSNQ
jgi:hypothetical protein